MRKPSCLTDAGGASAGRSGGDGVAKKTPCCGKVGLKKGPWTPEEDEVLSNYIKREGEGRWRTLPKRAGLLRCGKSCRLRWMNYLRPSVKRGQIAPDEEDLILRLHRLLGNRWSLIAGRIPGRTDNEIKNYWNTHLSKKLISQGIDPRTHKPLDVHVQFQKSKSKNHSTPPNPKFPSRDSKSNINPPSVRGAADTQISPLFQSSSEFGFDPITNNVTHSPSLNPNTNPGSLEEEDNDPNYCTEDVFSTFLNSLINEDLYTCQNQQQIVPHYDALLTQPSSSSTAGHLAFGSAGWDAPLMSNAPTSSSDHHR